MIGVTDPAYRRVIAQCGAPDVAWTEFVSAAGLARESRRVALLPMLQRSEGDRYCVAQLFGSDPSEFETAAGVVSELGCFDGIDINMGCPERNVTTSQGAGSALIRDMALAQRIVHATRRGAQGLPVSVKTRIGYDSIVVREWMNALMDVEPAAITLHLRTRNEMSAVPAHWRAEVVGVAVDVWSARKHVTGTRLLFNGDVDSLTTGAALTRFWGADGVMLGRALFGTPWMFADDSRAAAATVFEQRDSPESVAPGGNPPLPPLMRSFEQVLDIAHRHIDSHERQMNESRAADCRTYETWLTMRKHLRAYFNPFPNSKPMRYVCSKSDVFVIAFQFFFSINHSLIRSGWHCKKARARHTRVNSLLRCATPPPRRILCGRHPYAWRVHPVCFEFFAERRPSCAHTLSPRRTPAVAIFAPP
jgi:tRNA-dihydrouridine synthase